jgi:hypothetical protein
MAHFTVSLGSTLSLLHGLEVGPRDGLPAAGRPTVAYSLSDCFAEVAPSERVEEGAWRLYRDAHGLSDANRDAYDVVPCGPGTAAHELLVVADSPEDAWAKFALYNGVVATFHEAHVAQLDDAPPPRKKGA